MAAYRGSERISSVGVTEDTITGRGGLAFFVRYLSRSGIYALLEKSFGKVRKSAKGQPIWRLFMQVFCFFFDGSSKHLSYFDVLKEDEGYAATLEGKKEDLTSSHSMKRFFKGLGFIAPFLFRKILNQLFRWRLQQTKPRVIEVTIDTMVLDNDEAQKRHGVQPTYKKKKGFQPLHMIWLGKIVDAVFRGGKKNGNAGNTVLNMIKRMVPLMREVCGKDVLIVLRMDAGFLDEKIIDLCNKLKIGLILSGKIMDSVKRKVKYARKDRWLQYRNGRIIWDYLEFKWGCDSWKREYRAFYTRVRSDANGQLLLEFARPDNVILTNLGVFPEILANCTPEERAHWLKPETIIGSHHGRGADELPHRALKEFGFEEMPFKRFGANAAFYWCMLIAFFMHEAFKEDVLADVLPITSRADSVRRKFLDIAAKFVRHRKQIAIKFARSAMARLQLSLLWMKCLAPPPIPQM